MLPCLRAAVNDSEQYSCVFEWFAAARLCYCSAIPLVATVRRRRLLQPRLGCPIVRLIQINTIAHAETRSQTNLCSRAYGTRTTRMSPKVRATRFGEGSLGLFEICRVNPKPKTRGQLQTAFLRDCAARPPSCILFVWEIKQFLQSLDTPRAL